MPLEHILKFSKYLIMSCNEHFKKKKKNNTHFNNSLVYTHKFIIYIYIGWCKIWVLHPNLIEFNLIVEMSNSCMGWGTNEK